MCTIGHTAASQPVTGMRHNGQSAGACVASRAAAHGAQKAQCRHGSSLVSLPASMQTTQSASSPGAHTALAQGSSGAGGDSGMGARGVRLCGWSGLAALTVNAGRAAASAVTPSASGCNRDSPSAALALGTVMTRPAGHVPGSLAPAVVALRCLALLLRGPATSSGSIPLVGPNAGRRDASVAAALPT